MTAMQQPAMTPAPAIAPPPAMAPLPTASVGPSVPTRWGHQTSFFQKTQPAFWLFVILLVLTGLTTLADQLKVAQILPVAWFMSWLLLALWVIPVVVAIYVLDQFEREPLSIMAAAFIWGAVIATGLAIITNTTWFEIIYKLFGPEVVNSWGPALIGPPIEESLKYLGLVTIFLIARSEIDDLYDGFVYGALIGLGFATVENVGYFIGPVAQAGGADQIGPVFQMYLLRVLFSGFYMHVLWTGLTGVGLAYYVTRQDQPLSKRRLVAIGMFAAGVLSHFVWNSPFLGSLLGGNPGPAEMLLFGLFKGLPFLGFLLVLVFLSQRRERRWFETAVAAEVGTGALTADEVVTVGDMRSRFAARVAMGRTHGRVAAKLLGRLQREQIDLAMVRTRVANDDDPDLLKQRELVLDLKRQIAAVPMLPAPVPIPVPASMPMPVANPAPTLADVPAQSSVPTRTTGATPPPPPPPAASVWMPTHRIAAAGQTAWPAPDPGLPPVVTLAALLEVRLAEQTGEWARVVASNGWTGWVDVRLLTRIGG